MNFRIFACFAICGLLSAPTFAQAQNCCSQPPSGCCDNGGGCSLSGFGNNGCDTGCCDTGCCDTGCSTGCCDTGCSDYGCSGNGCSDSGCCDSGCCGSGGACCVATNYLSGFGGWTDWFDLGANASGNFGGPGTATADIETNDGFGVGVALGRYLNDNVRSEFEFAYRYNELDSITASATGLGTATVNLDGDINVFSGMYNMYYDFGRSSSRLRPYIGGGAGFAFVNTEANAAILGTNVQVNTETSTFAYQGMAGVSLQWSDRIDLFTEYRVFGIGEQSASFNIAGLGNASLDFDGLTHNIFFGARMAIR